jgi:hypothetical protein
VEQRGLECLLLAEHTHYPASRETPYPAGGELPRECAPTQPELLGADEEAGVHRFVARVRPGDRADTERRLDRLAAAVAACRRLTAH